MEVVFKILWTDFAINQLKDIFDYHSLNLSHKVVNKIVLGIIDATLRLQTKPKSEKIGVVT